MLVNELAPRPHNSGHYTIEAAETSQFENHLRGVLDLPLGEVGLRAPAAAMVNLLGTRTGPASPRRRARALAVPGAHLHLYDKAEVRPGRKMGHVTALGATRRGGPGAGPAGRGGGGPVSAAAPPLVGVVMGSDSDLPVVGGAGDVLTRARRAPRGAGRLGPPHARTR